VTSDIQSTPSTPLLDGKGTTVSSGMTSEVQATTNMLSLNSQETSTQEGTTRVTELEYVASTDTGVVTLPNDTGVVTLPTDTGVVTLPNDTGVVTLPNDTGVVTLPNESDKNEQEQAGKILSRFTVSYKKINSIFID
jgi:hypothetical protein